MWADRVNGIYEMLGGMFVMMHVLRLLKDKKVKGVSLVATVFFTSWGFWNLYYYPSLDQWWSFIGGLGIVTANTFWITLMIYYTRKNSKLGGQVR